MNNANVFTPPRLPPPHSVGTNYRKALSTNQASLYICGVQLDSILLDYQLNIFILIPLRLTVHLYRLKEEEIQFAKLAV